ncbi:MAG: hypothetical protein P8J37_11430 [Fuerstiella sp.]|nr:hypothetical protein [Fuerstiella sp.]
MKPISRWLSGPPAYPVDVEFAELPPETPPDGRQDFVFSPQRKRSPARMRGDTVSGGIVKFRNKASGKVDVSPNRKTTEPKLEFALSITSGGVRSAMVTDCSVNDSEGIDAAPFR